MSPSPKLDSGRPSRLHSNYGCGHKLGAGQHNSMFGQNVNSTIDAEEKARL